MEMPEYCPAVRTGLIEHGLHRMGQQGRRNSDQKSVIAGPFAPTARGDPSDCREHEEELFIGNPT